jgi:hypothetical protein
MWLLDVNVPLTLKEFLQTCSVAIRLRRSSEGAKENARRENRTPTSVKILDFESNASTSSAIRASRLRFGGRL